MRKFWKWTDQTETETAPAQRVLTLEGNIVSEAWFDDEVAPQTFRDELNSGTGDITVWINSFGGDCVAAAQIYNMLRDYAGKVTVKIDGIAASAASVVAMAGDTVLMSPVAIMLIHNPSMLVCGNTNDLKDGISFLDTVKESLITAYEIKTGLSRAKISRFMDGEYGAGTSMYAAEAVKLGFADGVIGAERETDTATADEAAAARKRVVSEWTAKLNEMQPAAVSDKPSVSNLVGGADKTKADSLLERLNLIKNWR